MKKTLVIENPSTLLNFVGPNDENLRLIRKKTNAIIVLRGNRLSISGEEKEVEMILDLSKKIIEILEKEDNLNSLNIRYLIENSNLTESINDMLNYKINIPKSRTIVTAKSKTQAEYLKVMENYELVIAIGPAGTGKTYLAVAQGLFYLLSGKCRRIILTRPVVEAGENLGFLPGTLEEKINPYLKPLTDSVLDIIGYERFQKLIETQSIEIAPLAYMRGRTLNDAFIILDEAQNTTSGQMQMFLTRLGNNSRIVITGDITQIDLPKHTVSGLVEILSILDGIKGIYIIKFNSSDVVRHPLVKRIIDAYSKNGR